MADFVPANIIQTPDFGQLARERIDRNRAEETAKNSFIDKFEKANGMYLEGDMPAVQGAWDNVQQTIDMVAENDSPEMRRKLKDAYGDYSRVAGTAQVLADQHRTQVASYKTDPTKYSMGGSEFFNWDENYRLQKRSYADMVSSLDNPNVLPSSAAYALLNPYDQAKVLMGDTESVLNSYYDRYGALNEDGLRTRIEDVARKKISGSPEAIERAIIWGATTNNNPESGFAGDGDGKINSLEELEMIKNLPEEERQNYYDAYVKALVDDYVGLVPNTAKIKSSGTKQLSTTSVSLQATGGEPVSFITLPSSLNGITQIGRAPNNEIFITVEEKKKTGEFDENNNEIEEVVIVRRPATELEISKIKSKFGGTYDLSELNPIAQEAPALAEAPTEQAVAQPENPLGLNVFDEPTGGLDPNAPPITEEPRPQFQQGDDATPVEEAVVEEAPVEEAPVEKKSGDYIVIGDKAYFKDDYKEVAGKRTGRGNYPETFEDYAKSMDVEVVNTSDKPIGIELEEVTVTAERDNLPVIDTGIAPPSEDRKTNIKIDEVQYTPQQWSEAQPSQDGSGKRNQETGDLKKIRYIPRRVIPAATEYVEGSGVPVPQNDNPSSTSAQPYYINNTGNKFQVSEGFEWTPETVKKAMDRWNTDIPVDPKLFIKASNRFGVPVELMIAMAAQEGAIGVGDRQLRTKNFFNWGNTTEGDNLPAGLEQDKYNRYYENWEDSVMHWADGMARRYRPESGDWSELWSSNKSFVDKDNVRYADSKGYEKNLREIIEYSIPKQFNDKTYQAKSK